MFRQALEARAQKSAGADAKPAREQIYNPVDIGRAYFTTADPRCQRSYLR